MNRAKIKYAPAINDLEHDKSNGDEGMEAVLFHKKGRKKLPKQIEERSSHSSSIDDSIIYERPENVELLNIIENNRWERLLYRILKKPHTAHVKFTGRSLKSTSAGNLILHEACKHDAPIDIIEALIEINQPAIAIKGHGGYLPYHCACANGAKLELIEYLYSIYPDAVQQVDDEGENALHLACKMGSTKEAVYMNLLTSYPEAVGIRDDFGRLPIDYAKNIRSDIHRKIAIECLHRANWLESAAKHSSERIQRKIRGYEQFQTQRLAMIEEIHNDEISKLELLVDRQRNELLEKTKDTGELEQRFQKSTCEYRKSISQLDKAKIESAQAQVALDLKNGELIETSNKLEETENKYKSLTQQLEQRYEDLELALDDIDTLNRHSEWLEQILGSIRSLANTEPPLVRDMQRKDEHQSFSTYESAAQSSSGNNNLGRNSTRTSSVIGRNSIGSSFLQLKSVSRGTRKGRVRNEASHEMPSEERDVPLVGRIIKSSRE